MGRSSTTIVHAASAAGGTSSPPLQITAASPGARTYRCRRRPSATARAPILDHIQQDKAPLLDDLIVQRSGRAHHPRQRQRPELDLVRAGRLSRLPGRGCSRYAPETLRSAFESGWCLLHRIVRLQHGAVAALELDEPPRFTDQIAPAARGGVLRKRTDRQQAAGLSKPSCTSKSGRYRDAANEISSSAGWFVRRQTGSVIASSSGRAPASRRNRRDSTRAGGLRREPLLAEHASTNRGLGEYLSRRAAFACSLTGGHGLQSGGR